MRAIKSDRGLKIPIDASSLSADEKRQLVQRVTDGIAFRRAPAICAFLRYVTEHTISGGTERLKEQVIGTDVFGRKPNYNPADDNIVRVRAYELRQRLEKHFATEGVEEQVLITMPRGSYAPEFVPRRVTQIVEPALPAVVPRAEAPQARKQLRGLLPAGALAVLAVAALILFLMKTNQHPAVSPTNTAIYDFWRQFFDKPPKEIKVVYADSSFALWQDMNGKTLDLGDYLSHKYLDAHGNRLMGEVAARRVTSPADLAVSVLLATLTAGFGGQFNPQYARNVNAEFFEHGNIVLIGSHRSNPWIEVYEPYLNFTLEQDPHSGAPKFVNRAPQSHEASMYAIPTSLDMQGDEEKEFTSYGVLALMKGCGDRGFLVLDEGLNMQATEAVGDLITEPQRLDTLLRSIGHKPGTNVAPFEVLIRITSLPGGYDNPQVVAYRLRPAGTCVGN